MTEQRVIPRTVCTNCGELVFRHPDTYWRHTHTGSIRCTSSPAERLRVALENLGFEYVGDAEADGLQVNMPELMTLVDAVHGLTSTSQDNDSDSRNDAL